MNWELNRCTSWVSKRQRNQRANCQHSLDHQKSKRVPKKIYFCFINYAKVFYCVDPKKRWKILQARVQQYMNWELPDVQAGFRKGRGTRDQHQLDHGKSKRVPEKKKPTFALLTMPKPFSVWITTNCGKFLKRWEHQTTLSASCKTCMQAKI